MKKNNIRKLVIISIVSFCLLFTGYKIINLIKAPINNNEQIILSNEDKENFIKKVAPYAVYVQKKTHVLASIQIAQAILESNWGQSTLSKKYNNYFGIKASGTNPFVIMNTEEYINNRYVTVKAKFARFDNIGESFMMHAELFTQNKRYENVVNASNYIQAAYALKNAGYATDISYTHKIISLIKSYHLYKYDQNSLGE
ncbi:MAG: glycoside hydrolase family 73 protein [Firmicutes bacterium]|uniref:Glycoside hydrolase family 73 protein n=1 Tax=Candidatus Gallilactobacillus intestinavium TaxID=2840838 RepID=A0A9D9E4R7_9LACO|nr:glycoside hydrolase family 73 protein [Candidatus Gallilactobacillus intestinavium]